MTTIYKQHLYFVCNRQEAVSAIDKTVCESERASMCDKGIRTSINRELITSTRRGYSSPKLSDRDSLLTPASCERAHPHIYGNIRWVGNACNKGGGNPPKGTQTVTRME